nr:hypothetical protein B0A51_07143 [Rachicladosporium sp. CCFEE 5018]
MRIISARLRDRPGLWDVVVADGKVVAITEHNSETPSAEQATYDAKGYLAVPQFCENHIHLDYANTAGVPRDNQSGTLFEAIEIWRDRKEAGLNRPEEIKNNALSAVRSCVEHGVGFIRSHADVTDPDLIALKVLLELRDEVKEWCEIQVVAFPQNGIIAFPHGKELMEKAMSMGADVVGGIPHLEPTYGDGVESLKFIFDLAQKYNAMVDVHCDEIDDPQSRFVDIMAAETTKRSMQGRVTVSHAVAMGYYPAGYLARLLPKLVESGVGFAIAPRENLQLQGRDFGVPTPRGVAPIRMLADRGISVAFSQDSICDPWYPIGDGNPILNMDSGLHIGHMLTAQYIDRCLDFISLNPATNMGLQDYYGLEEGKPASFLILGATSDREALRMQPRVLLSVHDGKEVFRQAAPAIEWKMGS